MGVYERMPGSGVWYVRYFDELGRKHREKVGPRKVAEALFRRRKTAIAERRFFPERRRPPALSQAIDSFLTRRKRDSVDYARYRKMWIAALHDMTFRSTG